MLVIEFTTGSLFIISQKVDSRVKVTLIIVTLNLIKKSNLKVEITALKSVFKDYLGAIIYLA